MPSGEGEGWSPSWLCALGKHKTDDVNSHFPVKRLMLLIFDMLGFS